MDEVNKFADRDHLLSLSHDRRTDSKPKLRRRITDIFEYYDPLRRVHNYVGGHYSEPISLGRAARIAGMEKTYFSAFFRQKAGIPFTTWLRQFRIEQANRLMRERDLPVSELAFAVGFRDLRTFERAFKKCTGHTARDFKKMRRPTGK
jgi:AraC-like DNA-binding protein